MSSRTREIVGPDPPFSGRLRDYRLLERIGRGGMGAVYLAVHERLERRVAIKVLPPDADFDAATVARFEREMKAIGRLQHPHIVQALDAGEEEGTHYLVLEYVDGADLSVVVGRVGPLSVADASEVVRQAAEGLQHAHENGLVHRDLKPSNLLLGRDGTVKILDLGLALLHGETPGRELTSTGQIMGTLDYIAPEQIVSTHDVDIRADLYSLGCTLYGLLTGRAPFAWGEHRNALVKMRAHESETAPSLREKRPDVPDGLVEVVERLLAKSPADRPAKPGELAAALSPFASGADLVALAERGHPSGSDIHPESELPTRSQVSVGPSDTHIAPHSLPEGDSSESVPTATLSAESVHTPTAQRSWLGPAVAVIGLAIIVALATLRPWVSGEETVADAPTDLAKVAEETEPVEELPPAFTPPDSDPSPVVNAAADATADAEIVEWVISVGGRVVVLDPMQGSREIRAAGELRPTDRLWSIDLGRTAFEETDLSLLAHHPTIEIVSFDYTELTGSCAIHLRTMPALRWLKCDGTKITNRALHDVAAIPSLTHFYAGRTPVSDEGLGELAQAASLEEIRVWEVSVGDDGLAKLGALPLKHLFLSNTRVTGSGLARGFDAVEILDLDGAPVTREGVVAIGRLRGLRKLTLTETSVVDEWLAPIRGLTELESLFLNDTPLEGAGLQHVDGLARLEMLELGGTDVDDAGVARLRTLPELMHLGLRDTRVGNTSLGGLAKLPKLKSMLIDGTNVTTEGVAVLAKFETLTSLGLSRTEIGDEAVGMLSGFSNLTYLNLDATNLSEQGFRTVREALAPKCTVVGEPRVDPEAGEDRIGG